LKLPQEILEWLEERISAVSYGDIQLIIHMREGIIDWIEKISRETEKVVDRTNETDKLLADKR
jgi:hypothetical protein